VNPRETDIGLDIRAQHRFHLGWDLIADLAARQHGTVGRFQLLELGFKRAAIARLVKSGRLIPIHRGVYAVGHRKLSDQGYRMSAVLSGGRGAVLSHRAAGAEWTLRSWSGRAAITVPSWRRSTYRVEIYSATLRPDEVTVLDGIPITTVPRTLLDLATVLDHHELLRAVNVAVAGAERFADALSWLELLERHRGERGTARLREVLEGAGYAMGVTDETLEELFARFITERKLPSPALNATVQVGDRFYRPDCLWREQKLIVELKSVTWHSSAGAINKDSKRDRHLLLAGYRVIHVTWAQLNCRREADELELDLRAALGLRK